MPVQFRDNPGNGNLWGGIGELLGGLGGLVGGGLGAYGIQKYNQGQKEQSFEKLGFSKEESKAISKLPENIQSQFIKDKMKQQEAQRQSMILSQALGGSGISQYPTEQILSGLGNVNPGMQPMQSDMNVSNPVMQQQMPQEQSYEDKMRGLATALNPQQLSIASKIIRDTKRQQLDERKQLFAEQKEARKEQHISDRETKPFYEKINTESKEAKKTNMRLNRMEELVKKGNIRHPFWNSLFETVASGVVGPHGPKIDLHFLQNPDTTEFRKLSREFVKSAKTIFGSRVTEGEIKLLLESVPSLSQTDEGKLRIINNLRLINDGAMVEKNAMDRIIEANGGKRPADIEDLVSKLTTNELDKIAEQFKMGVRS